MKRSLIILPLGLPVDWPADYELQTARALSRNHIVIMVAIGEGQTLRQRLRKTVPVMTRLSPSLYLFRPIYILPFQRFAPVRTMNAFLSARHLSRIISAHPDWRDHVRIFWSFSLQYTLFPKHFENISASVYDCIDAFVSQNPHTNRKWRIYEQRHLSQADIVFVNSGTLYARMRHRHAHVYRTGEGLFPLDDFRAQDTRTEPADLRHIPHPRILFAGNIGSRLDYGLLHYVIRRTPEIRYILIGKPDYDFDGIPGVDVDRELTALRSEPNVHFLGYKPKQTIGSYIRHCDAGIVPYDTRLAFNRYSYPMKIQEFFYYGKPVVTTPVGDVRTLAPHVSVITSPDDAVRAIRSRMRTKDPSGVAAIRRRIARSNSIQTKLDFVCTILDRHIRTRAL